jgi:hypothetical protein
MHLLNVVRRLNFSGVFRSGVFSSYYGVVFRSKYTTDVQPRSDNVVHDVIISGGGLVGTAMATALGSMTSVLSSSSSSS